MADTDQRKVLLGALLLLAGSAIIFGVGGQLTELPGLLASLAAIGLAIGALLLGTSEPGRPV